MQQHAGMVLHQDGQLSNRSKTVAKMLRDKGQNRIQTCMLVAHHFKNKMGQPLSTLKRNEKHANVTTLHALK